MRTRWFFLGVGAIGVIVLFAFPLWWPLVNTAPAELTLPGLTDLPLEEQPVIESIAREDRAYAEALIATGLAEPSIVPMADQEMPQMLAPDLYATGEFTMIDAVRRASGTVMIYRQADGSWLLRLEDFEVRNGPQLHLVLSAHPEPRTPEEVREAGLGLDWGPLRGEVGSQNFQLPASFDMDQVQSVVIYAVMYQEVFSSAQLVRQ
ncbi:MAG: DM13 domain-containing protein [Anaerolineae bacterium]|nr:DM13 domain-containing protein [Anaerolineae bacterium]